MRRDDELASLARLTQPLHKQFESLWVQTVIDFLDAGKCCRLRIVEQGEQAEQPDRSVRGVRQLSGFPQALLVETSPCVLRGQGMRS